MSDNRTNILARYGIIVFFILVISVAIVAKLVDTTLIMADQWNLAANRELNRVDTIFPTRGNILAEDGAVLATNLKFYTVRIDFQAEKFKLKKYKECVDSLADSLAYYYPMRNREAWKKYLEGPAKIKHADERPRSFKVVTDVSNAELERIKKWPFFNIGNRNKTGLKAESYMRRYNPYGDMARRSIGGVGATAECKEVHGISGLEKALDSLLYGKIGFAKKVALTKKITNRTDVEALRGFDIVTTINIQMQDIVERELNNGLDSCAADWGVAVLMDVKTGEIKAISNLEKNPKGPGYIEARNRAVMGYEPGSVVKTLSMMVAVDDGIVNLNEQLPTGAGWAYAGGRPITDSHHSTSIRAGDVIEQSSNIGMARIITRTYNDHPGQWYSRIKRLGFLDPMHTGIAGEQPPRFDSVPEDRGGRIALSRMAYGYATEIPPLYTLSIYNAIANDGVYVRPRLVKELHGPGVDSIMPVSYMGNGRACKASTAQTMRHMLKNVVWGDHGTGKSLRNKSVEIAGKTGTCYMIENGAYNTGKKRLAFCGFFPADEPKFSCIVLICHPTKDFFGAASTSGRVLKNIALKLYSRGLLDNASDFHADRSDAGTGPTFLAGSSTDLATKMGAGKTIKTLSMPKKHSGVPDLKGMGARQAVAALEACGYEARLEGSGHVTAQSAQPGTNLPKGSAVKISLSR